VNYLSFRFVLYVVRKAFLNTIRLFYSSIRLSKFFYSDFFHHFFWFLKNGSNDFTLNFRMYSSWDFSTFDVRHIAVKSTIWKLLNKWPHLRVETLPEHWTCFVRIQTLLPVLKILEKLASLSGRQLKKATFCKPEIHELRRKEVNFGKPKFVYSCSYNY